MGIDKWYEYGEDTVAVAGKKDPFKSKSIDKSPQKGSVYVLHDEDKVIYYGETSDKHSNALTASSSWRRRTSYL